MTVPGDKPGGKPDLPLDSRWASEEDYVQSLLSFATSSAIFQNLCGGVHVLDFLTREPDLYTTVLPNDWRDWFHGIDIYDILELLLRADLSKIQRNERFETLSGQAVASPPQSLVEYIDTIRKHCLQRQFTAPESVQSIPRHISVGMKPKKIHEVRNFATYVDRLSDQVSEMLGEPVLLVDFGSGQNYLGRSLASPPYRKHVIAIEKKHHNVQGARGMDVHAKLAKKEKIMRNKKEYKKNLATMNGLPTPPADDEGELAQVPDAGLHSLSDEEEPTNCGHGSMTYVEHDIQDGYLENVLYPKDLSTGPSAPATTRQKAITISLHSCGNLSHHALRSLPLNSSVTAVAIIGCCHNLLTERLGPTTYKLPQLRPNHPRLESTSSAFDPHGFPLSNRLENFRHRDSSEVGIRLNITARMLGVQAPQNWGKADSEMFFRRHFYRALLQRILLDRGVVKQASSLDDMKVGSSLSGKDDRGTPLIVGSLRKACFTDFNTYVKGAMEKLNADPVEGKTIQEKTSDLTYNQIAEYEAQWGYAKKNLAVLWSLMAFSAGVVESMIVVDRWLFLKEQECVKEAWVENVFDFALSPRNLVVVGIKKPRS